MTDYDINKVSPRPWTFACDFIDGADGKTILEIHGLEACDLEGGKAWNHVRYMVHCVNEHDDLHARPTAGELRELLDRADIVELSAGRGDECTFCGTSYAESPDDGNCTNPDCPAVRARAYCEAHREAKGMTGLNALRDECHDIAVAHGFWDEAQHDAVYIALMHSELSEALEARRSNEPMDEELADCIIRVLDYCGAKGIDIENAVRLKMNYNRSRPMKHEKEF